MVIDTMLCLRIILDGRKYLFAINQSLSTMAANSVAAVIPPTVTMIGMITGILHGAAADAANTRNGLVNSLI